MTSHDPLAYLEDILISARLVQRYVELLTFQQFVDNALTRDAVVHRLEIIGEAASNVGSEVSAALPAIPWIRMKNMRNVMAHQYWGIDLNVVWHVVHDELPPLIAAIESYNASLGNP